MAINSPQSQPCERRPIREKSQTREPSSASRKGPGKERGKGQPQVKETTSWGEKACVWRGETEMQEEGAYSVEPAFRHGAFGIQVTRRGRCAGGGGERRTWQWGGRDNRERAVVTEMGWGRRWWGTSREMVPISAEWERWSDVRVRFRPQGRAGGQRPQWGRPSPSRRAGSPLPLVQ